MREKTGTGEERTDDRIVENGIVVKWGKTGEEIWKKKTQSI